MGFFAVFPRCTGFKNLGFFRGFLRFLGDPNNSQNADFSAVSRDFEGRARPKKSSRFSRDEQVLKFGFSRGFLQFLGNPKNSQNADFSAVSRDFEGRARPKIFGTRVPPQFSWDFEGTDPPKNLVNPQTYPQFSWTFEGMDPPEKFESLDP